MKTNTIIDDSDSWGETGVESGVSWISIVGMDKIHVDCGSCKAVANDVARLGND